MAIRSLFPTRIYEAPLAEPPDIDALCGELESACMMLAREDRAGRAWCRANGYGGYTSYASLNDLPRRATAFELLRKRLDRHVATFAQASLFELDGRRLKLDSLWVNVLKPGAAHSGHIHPHAVVSGVVYVRAPAGAGSIRFEDPRLPLMMAAPPRRADAPEADRSFVYLAPQVGAVILWESWLRHEVARNAARTPRISVSFNYAWR